MQYEYSATKDSWLQEAMFAKDKKQYLLKWQEYYEKSDFELLNKFELIPNISDLKNLPPFSFILRVPFKLKKPYLSKDDRSFHLLDNPVRKDKVFQTPMVASTSWKGALHHAMVQQLTEWWCNLDERDSRNYQKQFVARRITLIRLFGTEKSVDINDEKPASYLDNLGNDHLSKWYRRYIKQKISATGFFSGRLYFYPTFFDKIDLEVINPHDRKKGTSARGPIYLECVPQNATGELVILYVPFGKVEERQVIEDLELVVKGVKEMLTVYGFGAKTSSGFGVVEDQLNGQGKLAIRADIPELKKKLEFLNDDGTLKQEFVNDDGTFKTESQYKKFLQKQKKSHNSKVYKEAKQWYDTNKQEITELSFNKLSELRDRTQKIIENLGTK